VRAVIRVLRYWKGEADARLDLALTQDMSRRTRRTTAQANLFWHLTRSPAASVQRRGPIKRDCNCPFAKTFGFPSGLPLSGLLPRKAQRLRSTFPTSSRVVSLRSHRCPASCLIPATRDHCVTRGLRAMDAEPKPGFPNPRLIQLRHGSQRRTSSGRAAIIDGRNPNIEY
jgi:hypothetical protein